MVHTRRDIAYDVGIVSRYMVRPTVMHWNTMKRIMRSLKGTLSYGLLYSARSNNNMLSGYSDSDFGYSDSDFAKEVDDRKSTEGRCFIKMIALLLGYLRNSVGWIYRLVKLSSWQLQQLHVKE